MIINKIRPVLRVLGWIAMLSLPILGLGTMETFGISFVHVSDLTETIKTVIGDVPDRFVKFFYVLLPIATIEIIWAVFITYVHKLSKQFTDYSNYRRFNGFYGWHNTEKNKGGKTDVLEMLYIRYSVWMIICPLSDQNKCIRYWRRSKEGRVSDYETSFGSGLSFKHDNQKQIKTNEVILIGAKQLNVGEESLFLSTKLITYSEEHEVFIDACYPSKKEYIHRRIKNNPEIFKALKSRPQNKLNSEIDIILDKDDIFNRLFSDSRNRS
ncbi:MAG: hypothetical protein LBQ94_04500 [Treponema sp.]|jgi:hypothetical protein|nr:hypothetical protein [Treponema sp.]